MERFCVAVLGGLYLEGLVHGGAYFRNFTVFRGDRTAVQCMKTETNCPLKGSL